MDAVRGALPTRFPKLFAKREKYPVKLRFERALFVGAHLDDFEFGCVCFCRKMGRVGS